MSDNESVWLVKSASGAIVPTRAAITSPEPDCRTCSHYRVLHASCHYQPCTDADRYEPLPPVRLWRTEK